MEVKLSNANECDSLAFTGFAPVPFCLISSPSRRAKRTSYASESTSCRCSRYERRHNLASYVNFPEDYDLSNPRSAITSRFCLNGAEPSRCSSRGVLHSDAVDTLISLQRKRTSKSTSSWYITHMPSTIEEAQGVRALSDEKQGLACTRAPRSLGPFEQQVPASTQRCPGQRVKEFSPISVEHNRCKAVGARRKVHASRGFDPSLYCRWSDCCPQ